MSQENPLKSESPRLCSQHGSERVAGCAECFPLDVQETTTPKPDRANSRLLDHSHRSGKIFNPGPEIPEDTEETDGDPNFKWVKRPRR